MPDSVDRPGGTRVTAVNTVAGVLTGRFATGVKRLPVEQVLTVVAVPRRQSGKAKNVQVEAGMNKSVRRFYLK